MKQHRSEKWAALALFLLSAAGFAALIYSHGSELHGPSIMVGLLMAVCTGAFGVLTTPSKDFGPGDLRAQDLGQPDKTPQAGREVDLATHVETAPRLTAWLAVENAPHCAMRCLAGADPADEGSRVAFIEKTPRVRIAPFAEQGDYQNWLYGPKGSAPEYGKYQPSRDWCDAELREMGYVLPD